MIQATMSFDPLPKGRARATDPETSWQAVESIPEKVLAGRCKVIYDALAESPDLLSYREIHARLGGNNYCEAVEVMRRLADLRDKNFVTEAGKRRCRVSGRSATTWRAV